MMLGEDTESATFWKEAGDKALAQNIKGVIMMGAHWDAPGESIHVATNRKPDKSPVAYVHPSKYVDYDLNPDLETSQRCISLLQDAGFEAEGNSKFDWIHDTYLILIRMFPDGCPPTTLISMNCRFDPHYHVRVGAALRSLRSEGYLFIGSGGSVHNLYRNLWMPMLKYSDNLAQETPPEAWALDFRQAVEDVIKNNSGPQLRRAMTRLMKHPKYRDAHATDDHFMASMFVAGLVGDEEDEGTPGKLSAETWELTNMCNSQYTFGAWPRVQKVRDPGPDVEEFDVEPAPEALHTWHQNWVAYAIGAPTRIANTDNSTTEGPLKVLVVGAGIGGLTAALGLRQQGHEVTIYEKSRLAQEVGAALHLAPNCHGILKRLGVYPESIGANPVNGVAEYTAAGDVKFSLDLRGPLSIWQHKWVLTHRVALHEELKELVTSNAGRGKPAVLVTGSPVVSVDTTTPSITLEDGSTVTGDLILGADGVASATRQAVVGRDIKPVDSGKSAFRFMVPCSLIEANETTRDLLKESGYLRMWFGDDRRLIMYPCSNNTIMNFAGIHPSSLSPSRGEGWDEKASKQALLDMYLNFGPTVQALLRMVDETKLGVWTLLDMERIPRWVNGRAALLGDAAHPFLPHQGQGGGIAIEDAASLCALLTSQTKKEDLTELLALYEKLRDERAHKVQEFTRRAGMDLNDANRKDFNIFEFINYNFSHDEWHNSSRALKEHLWSRNGPCHWRSPIAFGPMPSPRQDHYGRPIPADGSKFTAYSVRFRTSATLLKTLLPPKFSFASPGTIAEVSFRNTTLRGLRWLGGGGYNFFGLWIHGVQVEKDSGEKVPGSFLALLLESHADPVITGREELGMPKLFCDIDVTEEGPSAQIQCSWRGTTFARLDMGTVVEAGGQDDVPMLNGTITNGHESAEAPHQGDAAFAYRYVPAVGKPGVADAEYPVIIGKSSVGTFSSSRSFSKPQLEFTPGSWKTLPTIHHIAAQLSEIPIYEFIESKIEEGTGVDDLSHVKRLE